jgi:hypothetical protein
MLINLSHSSFTVRRYTTVKEVRLHSERGKAAVSRVVGIVATMPCRDMGATAPVTSWYGRRALEALLWLGEAALAPEPWRGRAKRNLRPRPRGSGEGVSASEP